jgi:hypothetical protein
MDNSSGTPLWLTIITMSIAVLAFVVSVISIAISDRANRLSSEANKISRDAHEFNKTLAKAVQNPEIAVEEYEIDDNTEINVDDGFDTPAYARVVVSNIGVAPVFIRDVRLYVGEPGVMDYKYIFTFESDSGTSILLEPSESCEYRLIYDDCLYAATFLAREKTDHNKGFKCVLQVRGASEETEMHGKKTHMAKLLYEDSPLHISHDAMILSAVGKLAKCEGVRARVLKNIDMNINSAIAENERIEKAREDQRSDG